MFDRLQIAPVTPLSFLCMLQKCNPTIWLNCMSALLAVVAKLSAIESSTCSFVFNFKWNFCVQ